MYKGKRPLTWRAVEEIKNNLDLTSIDISFTVTEGNLHILW
jgi:hypothetical protein